MKKRTDFFTFGARVRCNYLIIFIFYIFAISCGQQRDRSTGSLPLPQQNVDRLLTYQQTKYVHVRTYCLSADCMWIELNFLISFASPPRSRN